jgi:hypothetical protein
MSLRHLLVIVFVFVATAVSAQTNSITGRVTDAQEGAVAAAVVTLDSSSAAARTTSTGSDGVFTFTDVSSGLHVLQIEAPGFQPLSRNISVSTATSRFGT